MTVHTPVVELGGAPVADSAPERERVGIDALAEAVLVPRALVVAANEGVCTARSGARAQARSSSSARSSAPGAAIAGVRRGWSAALLR